MGEKETATAESLGGAGDRGRTGNLVQLDDKSGAERVTGMTGAEGISPQSSTALDFEEPTGGRTVKSGKSNSSDWRAGSDEPAAAEATTTKSSKSNSSD